jgi:hypothetical protein
MNSVANENQRSGKKALKGLPGSVTDAKSTSQDGKAPLLHLDISWHVAPAQIVAILDLSGKDDHDLSPLASAGPIATATHAGLQKYKYV